ncbi:Inositol phosphorylceramide synthase regulatory subunit KEI1 [Candida viswanathii]|uniref:Inositol phosphorylceramide synthase regulatory subunit KEI1 n=1 Tax=Candida viswanathii TaxID=5486 RepID=A0A367XTJ9_9ASCO|nr:Inositol phosphorylceramide synthase regulatory subunit KEI1 [Candida viswanathii]
MARPVLINQLLPIKFFGVIPLFIGVEIILGITILNKASGLYGILSLFTGHPINFWQWLYNLLSLITLPVYASALINLKVKPKNLRKTSLATIVYVLDTLIGSLFTLYFIYFWFSLEDGSVKSEGQDATVGATSQSASPARELSITISTTIVVTVVRFYFTLVMISFTKALLKQNSMELRYNANQNDQPPPDPEEEELMNAEGFSGEFRKALFDLETRSKEYLNELFS